jgi:hypothetical protein
MKQRPSNNLRRAADERIWRDRAPPLAGPTCAPTGRPGAALAPCADCGDGADSYFNRRGGSHRAPQQMTDEAKYIRRFGY